MNEVKDLRPLVVLGVPSGDRVHWEFANCLWGLARGAKHHRQGVVFGRSSIVAQSRNMCVDAAKHLKADYLMFLDSDMTFPYTIVDELLKHQKDIVCCTYVRRGPPFDNLGHTLHEKDKAQTKGLVQMSHIPTGLLLIKMGVFEKFKAPFFRFESDEKEGINRGEDFVFSEMARTKGFNLWCDLTFSEECAHLYQYALRPNDPSTRQAAEAYKAVANG